MADSLTPFRRALNERVRERARMRGTSPQDELRQWVLQRVMVRLFAAQPDLWIIKGGQIQLAHWADGRSTDDADVSATDEVPATVMAGRFNDAMGQDMGDHLRFVPAGGFDTSIMDTGRAARMLHTVYLGDKVLMEVQTDAALPDARPRWKPVKDVPFPEQIHASGAEGENPVLRMLDPHDVLLHKITGMHMMSRDGNPPFRVQDMVDTLFLADRLHLDGPDLHAILQKEVAYQHAEYGRLRMPADRFELPNPNWHEGYAAYAASTPGLAYKTLDTAVPAMQRFLDPLLGTEPPQADWNPDRKEWVARTAEGARGTAVRQSRTGLTSLDNPRGAGPDIRGYRGRASTTAASAQPAHDQDQGRRRGRGA
ncbi:nucleotidyl transferase AbiEii/AbiGii toxin family protein [Nocardiopsis sediminis]|uniref:Nucleotidyl transferase AbiEii/AbiGii toxin family protein n=1 Tax=Nocardiopsis sediminis TaxID=1778267 RepID=A0ABV8FPN4_9ACTN